MISSLTDAIPVCKNCVSIKKVMLEDRHKLQTQIAELETRNKCLMSSNLSIMNSYTEYKKKYEDLVFENSGVCTELSKTVMQLAEAEELIKFYAKWDNPLNVSNMSIHAKQYLEKYK